MDVVEAMAREASFLLEIKDKCSDLAATNLSHICAHSSRAEKVCKIIYAIGNNGYGIVAFSFACGTELVTAEQSPNIRAKI